MPETNEIANDVDDTSGSGIDEVIDPDVNQQTGSTTEGDE